MSQYTISLNSIINIEGTKRKINCYADLDKKLEVFETYILDSSHYTFTGDETFRKEFIQGFIGRYLQEDICYEDIDLWKLVLNNDIERKSKIYYNKYSAINSLIQSQLGLISKTTSEAESSASSDGHSVNSEYPANVANAINIDAVNYASSGIKSSGSSKGTSIGTSTIEGNPLDKIELYYSIQRDVIDDMIKEFNNLFMLVW